MQGHKFRGLCLFVLPACRVCGVRARAQHRKDAPMRCVRECGRARVRACAFVLKGARTSTPVLTVRVRLPGALPKFDKGWGRVKRDIILGK
jgi:hypothetical protein